MGFFTDFFTGGNGGANIGASGISGQIVSTCKEELSGLNQLPGAVSMEDVMEEAKGAMYSNMSVAAMSEFIRHRGQRVNNIARMYALHAQYTQTMMNANKQMVATDVRHHQARATYEMAMGVGRAQVSGIDEAIQSARTLVG